MPLQLKVQFDIVIYSLLAGVITGVLFDSYRILRGKYTQKFIIIVQDVLFWLLSTLVIFTFLLYTNYAFLGPYVYVFILLSLILYFKLISTYLIQIEKVFFNVLGKIIRVGYKNAIYPIKLFLYQIGNKKWTTSEKLLE